MIRCKAIYIPLHFIIIIPNYFINKIILSKHLV